MADRILRTPNRDTLKRGRHLIPDFVELSVMDISKWEDDFMGDQMKYDATAPGAYQSTASGAASAVAAILTGTVNGAIRLDPGTADAGRSDLSLGLHFRGDRNPVIWWKFTTPANVGSWKFEFGFTDKVSGTDAGAVNVKATPTFFATDAVVLCRDTNNNTNLSLLGVANGVAGTTINFSTALIASTDYYVGVALVDGNAFGYLLDGFGSLVESVGPMTSAVRATILLTPWAFCQNRSGAQRLLDIDYLLCYQRRTATNF